MTLPSERLLFSYAQSVDAGVVSLNVILDALLANCPSATTAGRAGAKVRQAIGDLKANAEAEILNKTVGTSLGECFSAAYDSGITYVQLERTRLAIMADSPTDSFAIAVKITGLVLTFSMQCRRITTMTFGNRDDVANIMQSLGVVIEDIKMEAADALHSQAYQQLGRLAAAVMQHLAVTEAKVPQVVYYDYRAGFPALALAFRIYQDSARSEQLIAENRVVHPAFFPLRVRALSR